MRATTTFALTLTAFACLAATDASAGDPVAGEKVFRKCQACHAVGEGAKNKVGPELNGIVGRKAGSAPGFNYSKANTSSGVTWTAEVLDEYLTNPRKFMPGTKMAFPGLRDDAERADVIAFLAQFK